MAFFTDPSGKRFVRDFWPTRLRRSIQGDPEDVGSANVHQILPVESLALAEFLLIIPRVWPAANLKDKSRPWTVVTAPDINEDTGKAEAQLFEFKLRIQGFLGNHNLGHVGSWEHNPIPGRCSGAVQFLELHSGDDKDCESAWDATIARINHMGSVIANKTNKGKLAPMFDPKARKIHFQRRVFVKGPKQRDGMNTPIPSQVTHLENELIRAAKSGWFLEDKKDFYARLTKAGYPVRTDNFPFDEGNFVDVTAALDIVTRPERPQEIKLRLERIVLLDTAGAAKKRKVKHPMKTIKQREDLVIYEADEIEDEDEHDAEYNDDYPAPLENANEVGNDYNGNGNGNVNGNVNDNGNDHGNVDGNINDSNVN